MSNQRNGGIEIKRGGASWSGVGAGLPLQPSQVGGRLSSLQAEQDRETIATLRAQLAAATRRAGEGPPSVLAEDADRHRRSDGITPPSSRLPPKPFHIPGNLRCQVKIPPSIWGNFFIVCQKNHDFFLLNCSQKFKNQQFQRTSRKHFRHDCLYFFFIKVALTSNYSPLLGP